MDNHVIKAAPRTVTLSGIPVLGMHRYRLEPDGRLVFLGANPGADLILGIDHSLLVGRTIDEIFPSLATTEIPEIYRTVAREGIPWHMDQVVLEHGQILYPFQVQAFQTSPGEMAVLFQDIRERQQIELSIKKRDAILSAVTFAAEQFLGNGDWRKKIQSVLSRLGQAAEASRFYLCENQVTPKGEILVQRLFEWQDPHLQKDSCDSWLINFNFKAMKFSRWIKLLSKGEAIYGAVETFPEPERALLAANGIRSIAIAPILVNQDWWGIIGFDDCREERLFSGAEIDALKTAANTIGAAIQRTIHDLKIRQNAARAQAIVKAGARLNAVLDPQSLAVTVCSEIGAALHAKAASVYLYDEQKKVLECLGGFNLPEECARKLPPIQEATLNLYLHKWGVPLYLREENALLHFFNVPIHQMLGALTIVTWLLLYDQKLIGILNIAFEDPSHILDSEELELLEGLCNQASLAFNNARLYALERRRSQEFASLYELAINVNRAQNTQEALENTLTSVQDLLDAEAGLAILPDERKSLLTIPQANGFFSANKGWVTGLNETWFDSISRTITPSYTDDFSKVNSPLAHLRGTEQAGPAVFIPLLSAQKLTGLLLVSRQKEPQAQPFSAIDLKLLHAIGELAGNAVQKNQFYEDAQRRLTFLQALRAIDIEISSSLDLMATLQVVVEEAISQLQVDAADILVINPETGTLELKAAKGFQEKAFLQASLASGNLYAREALTAERMVIVTDLINHSPFTSHAELLSREGFRAYVAVPLFSKWEIKGVMEVYRRQPLKPDQEWFEFLETLSGQAAIAIENITLFMNLQQTNTELMQAYDTTIEGWSTALDLKDADTKGHTQRVTQMAVLLADAVGIDRSDLVHVRRGAMLHDIGKMGVPDQILRKPGPLNEEEWQIMKKHPVYAYEWLSPTTYLHPALDIPYCHHEKWDGSGYPQGLKGESIPLKARIFSVVDVWDALSSDRPYRPRWSQPQVIQYIRDQAGTHFDPEIVPVFLELLQKGQAVM